MTIALPPSGKFKLALFGRKESARLPVVAAKPLGPRDVARLFQKGAGRDIAQIDPPAQLSVTEQQERDRLLALRRALYAKP